VQQGRAPQIAIGISKARPELQVAEDLKGLKVGVSAPVRAPTDRELLHSRAKVKPGHSVSGWGLGATAPTRLPSGLRSFGDL